MTAPAEPRSGGEFERQPRAGAGWIHAGRTQYAEPRNSVWQRGRFRVISGLDDMELPQSGGLLGPTWHISAARRGSRRPTDEEMHRIRNAFGMRDAEEDNHMPGLARHLFMPVDPRYRGICDCKETELTIVEADGHRWQTPETPGAGHECLACGFEPLTGMPCPVHHAPESRP